MVPVGLFYGIYSLFKAYSLYGLWSVLLIPLWIIFCVFTGIPNIINVLRLSKLFTSKEITIALIVNTINASLIFIILELLNAEDMQSNFLIGGILTAFSMPYGSLLNERLDQIEERKEGHKYIKNSSS